LLQQPGRRSGVVAVRLGMIARPIGELAAGC
jgi:hypothetical protein